VPLKRRDEWGLLAQSYNRMADEIEQAMERNAEIEPRIGSAHPGSHGRGRAAADAAQPSGAPFSPGFLTARLAHDMEHRCIPSRG